MTLSAGSRRVGRPQRGTAGRRSRFSTGAAVPLVLVALAGIIGLTSSPADAHASLLSANPAADSELASAPAAISLTFSEAPDLGLSSIEVLDMSGAALAGPRATGVAGKASIAQVALPKLGVGSYTVSWRVVSAIDGHLTAGAYSFGVGTAAGAVQGPPRVASPPPAPLAVAGRFLLLWGVALLFGAATASLLVFRRTLPAFRWALPACFALAWAGFGMLVVSQAHRANATVGRYLGSARGDRLLREGAVLILLAVAAVLASRSRSRWSRGLLLASATIAIIAHVMTGHAPGESVPAYSIAVQSLHIMAVGAWIGGFGWLLAGLRSENDRGDAVGRYARLAAGSLAVVALTGFLRALAEVRTFRGLLHTGFGQIVGVKSLLFLPLLALGAYNHYRSVPRIKSGARTHALQRVVFAEIAIATALFVLTGALTELPPSTAIAQQESAAPKPEQIVLDGADFTTTLRAHLVISPGRPGRNQFRVAIRDFDTRAPYSVKAVRLRLSLPSQPDLGEPVVEMKRSGDDWTAVSSAMSLAGTWRIVVEVSTSLGAVEVPLSATFKSKPTTVRCVSVPGQPTLCTADLPGLGSVQEYADPGTPGANELHATFFDLTGRELAINGFAIKLHRLPSGAAVPAKPHRLTPGHFSAPAVLAAGTYSMTVSGTTTTGRRVYATFSVVIASG